MGEGVLGVTVVTRGECHPASIPGRAGRPLPTPGAEHERSPTMIRRLLSATLLTVALIGGLAGRGHPAMAASFHAIDLRGSTLPDGLQDTYSELVTRREALKSVAFGPHEAWVVLYGRNGYVAHEVPAGLIEKE